MGINSQEVSYGFGQMGSAFIDGANKPLYPPKDMVIVAVTFLTDTKLELLATNAGGLTSDTVTDAAGETQSPWISTDVAAHLGGNYTDADMHNSNGLAGVGVFELAADATGKIVPGMIIESATMFPRDLNDPYIVKEFSHSSGQRGTAAKRSNPRVAAAVAANVADGANEKGFFLDPNTIGRGGAIVDSSNVFPKGVTIYGRWTAIEIANGETGSFVAYFGQ